MKITSVIVRVIPESGHEHDAVDNRSCVGYNQDYSGRVFRERIRRLSIVPLPAGGRSEYKKPGVKHAKLLHS